MPQGLIFSFFFLYSYAVIANGCAECPKLSCGQEGCGTEFCYHCRQLWHPDQTCDQARRQRSRNASGNNDASTMFTFNEETGSGTLHCLIFLSQSFISILSHFNTLLLSCKSLEHKLHTVYALLLKWACFWLIT